jgi:hypothetical protein
MHTGVKAFVYLQILGSIALHPFDWYSDGLLSFVPACGTPFPITGFANISLSNWIQMHVLQLFLQLPATEYLNGIIPGLP